MKKSFLFLLLNIFLVFNLSFKLVNKDSAYIVLDKNTNRILEEQNSNKQMLIASTVKILTAITVIENFNIDEEITITNDDASSVGSSVYLSVDESIKRRDLLYALMLRSANDAASALPSNNSFEFMYKMNEMAKKIGMYNSVFENASGLDEREYNISTAYDLALLASYASKNDTFVGISSAHNYSCQSDKRNYNFTNKHKLVKTDDSFIWGKTGFTKKSSRVLVSNYSKDNMTLIIVTINDSDDWNHHKELINDLDDYEFKTIFDKGVYDISIDCTYYLHIKESIIIPIKGDEEVKLKFILYKDKAILNIILKDKVIATFNIEVYDKKNINPEILIKELY
jgi:D-alanyl-D-alanine carboxypeptidase